MATWRELGEVPDSDDDGDFDSQGQAYGPTTLQSFDAIPRDVAASSTPQAAPTERPVGQASRNTKQSIWDVPDSSPAEYAGMPSLSRRPATPDVAPHLSATPASSPLSSVPDDDELAEMFMDEPVRLGIPAVSKPARVPASRGASPDPLDFGPDDVSAGLVELTEPQPDFLLDQESTTPSLPPVSPRPVRRHSSAPPSPGTANAIEAAVTAALRYERSLRPRKPIQEHPYMIESAQYNNALKARGIRPVRMAVEAEARGRRRTPEEDSQEQEFQEESQNTVSEGHGESLEDSQPLLLDALDDSVPLPIFPSSSTHKDSSQQRHSVPSSPFSLSRETNATSPFIGNHLVGGEDVDDDDDDDLPSLDQLLAPRKPSSAIKRHPSSTLSSSRKRARQNVPDSHLELTPGKLLSPRSPQVKFRNPRPLPPAVLRTVPKTKNRREPQAREPSVPAAPTPGQPRIATSERHVVDLSIWDLSDSSDANEPQASVAGEATDTDSSNGSEMVTFGRRAHGVLPASHFRLDQPKTRQKPHPTARARQTDAIPDSTQRRGVAVRRTTTLAAQSPAASAFPFELFDDESDTETVKTPRPNADRQYSQLVLHIEDNDDDDLSVLEDNDVDHMVQRTKRQLNRSDSSGGVSKKRKVGQPSARQRQQPPITSHFATSTSSSVTAGKKQSSSRHTRGRDKQPRKRSKKSKKPPTAPRLGILDVIEPQAPRFLKIAARTVKSRPEKGRSSPSKKTICLGTRKDQIDAGRVLQDWTSGRIHPRPSLLDHSGVRPHSDRPPLTQISHNASSGSSDSRDHDPSCLDSPTNVSQHAGNRVPVSVPSKRATGFKASSSSGRTLSRNLDASSRPAQFEADVISEAGRVGFHNKKRMLDALYHRKPSRRSPAQSIDSRATRDDVSSIVDTTDTPGRKDARPKTAQLSRRKLKKTAVPMRVDTTAPRYRHAHDPLPAETPEATSSDTPGSGTTQLLGLGSFGVHYSAHFEVFPLESGAFFHEETLLGSGCFQASLDAGLQVKIRKLRPRVYFNLSGQPLRWGPWDEQVSSELGILVDAIFNHFTAPSASSENDFDAKDAASFIRIYIQDALSVADDVGLGFFLSRLLDVLGGFFRRLTGEIALFEHDSTQNALAVLSQLLVATLCGLSICRTQSSMIAQIMSLEELLRQAATTCVTCLLREGTAPLTRLYGHLQQLAHRERGIRADSVAAQAWVMLMKALGQLRIPRMSFWDLTFSVMIKPSDKTGADARRFEQLWETMFTLLPLCEFDVTGVLVPESRHDVAMDGWTLPQLALKRVFQLYRDDVRQPPGFNDYCRALVSRCVYLVDQWGWYKCSGVVGTIFDFFGSQNLSHLRNEEVFHSPAFLEHLHVKQALRIEPEDRCFHIFLKLIAIAIRRLQQTGSIREVRNLVTRTLPNHDRQFLKEQNVHRHDLAALRNHHDLLCTLFWATPAELRPNTLLQLLEKLVSPSSSHKEACLINLRAWAQLARFVVCEESTTSFRVFSLWQRSAFQQLLDQYNSTAADIHQQLSSMSSDTSHGISRSMMNGIIASNKAATMQVLQYSMTISLDVAKHARSLELAVFAGNLVQLQHVFRQFSRSPPDYPLGMLAAATATLEVFLNKVDSALEAPRSGQESHSLHPTSPDDSIMKLDNDLTADFFSMARCMLNVESEANDSLGSIVKRNECVEQVVAVAGRLAAVLVRCGTMRLSRCFKTSQRGKPGKHELFEGPPNQLGRLQSRYLPLFLATVHKQLDLADVGISVLQLWLLSLVKPREHLAFEDRFALSLKKQEYPFVPAESGMLRHADYGTNCELFKQALSWMRTSLRTTSSPSLKKNTMSEFSAALKAVMQQMQKDLSDLAMSGGTQHASYVDFVRRLVSLVKSHATEICQIPAFFYQVSKEYSPPVQDPQLQVDSIKSYGIRLGEGDPRAPPELFYYLYNNFKQALLHGKLAHESRMLAKGMREDAILGFALGKMLPVVLLASVAKPEAFVIYDVYCEAIRLRFDSPTSRQMDQSSCEQIPRLIQSVLRWISEIRSLDRGILCLEHLHLFRKMVVLLNTLQATLTAASFSSPLPAYWSDTQAALSSVSRATKSAEAWLALRLAATYEAEPATGLFHDSAAAASVEGEEEALVTSLARSTVTDFERNWLVTAETITAQAPARATQTGQGLKRPRWRREDLEKSLLGETRIWNAWWARCRAHVPAEASGESEQSILL